MKRFNLRALVASLVLAGAAVSPAAHAVDVSAGLNVGAGIVTSQSAISGTTTSTAVSNLAGTGSSNYKTNATGGGTTYTGGTIDANGQGLAQNQTSYATVATSGKITGGAQPFDSQGLTSNGAGSYSNIATAANVSGTFVKFGAGGNAYAHGFGN